MPRMLVPHWRPPAPTKVSCVSVRAVSPTQSGDGREAARMPAAHQATPQTSADLAAGPESAECDRGGGVTCRRTASRAPRPSSTALRAAGIRVLLPICSATTSTSTGRGTSPVQLRTRPVRSARADGTARSARTPSPQRGVVFCPGVAVDREGDRLGRGGGSLRPRPVPVLRAAVLRRPARVRRRGARRRARRAARPAGRRDRHPHVDAPPPRDRASPQSRPAARA